MSPTHTHTHSHTLCLPDTHDDVKTSSSFSPDRPFVQPSARDRRHSRSNWSARLLVLCKAQDYIINEFIILPVCYFDKYIYIFICIYKGTHTITSRKPLPDRQRRCCGRLASIPIYFLSARSLSHWLPPIGSNAFVDIFPISAVAQTHLH